MSRSLLTFFGYWLAVVVELLQKNIRLLQLPLCTATVTFQMCMCYMQFSRDFWLIFFLSCFSEVVEVLPSSLKHARKALPAPGSEEFKLLPPVSIMYDICCCGPSFPLLKLYFWRQALNAVMAETKYCSLLSFFIYLLITLFWSPVPDVHPKYVLVSFNLLLMLIV